MERRRKVPQPDPWNSALARRWFRRYLAEQRASDRRLAMILRDASLEAERMVARTVGDSVTATVRRAQYARHAAELRAIQAQLWSVIESETRRGIRRTSDLAVRMDEELAAFLSRPLPAAVREGFALSARNAARNVQSRYVNNIRLSPLIYKNQQLSNGLVDRTVTRGIALGKSAKEIAQDVAGMIRPNTPGGVSYAAMRLGRTELNNAFHTTSRLSYERMPFVEGVKWNLSGSHPRADVCDDFAEGNHDNLGSGVFKPNHLPGKPHPQCLCFTTAVTPSREAFARNLFGGDYDEFLVANGYRALGRSA